LLLAVAVLAQLGGAIGQDERLHLSRNGATAHDFHGKLVDAAEREGEKRGHSEASGAVGTRGLTHYTRDVRAAVLLLLVISMRDVRMLVSWKGW